MKLNTYTKFLLAILLGGITFASCKKLEEVDALDGRGQTIVKMMDAAANDTPFTGSRGIAIDFIASPQTVALVDLRREVPNNDVLNTPLTVTLKFDTAFLTKYNIERDSAGLNLLLPFEPSWYTVSQTNGVTYSSATGNITVTFQPGEFAKPIEVLVTDATVLSASEQYGVPFTVVSADAPAVVSNDRTFIAVVSAKNAYDGIYTVLSGNVTRYTSPGVPAGDALSGPVGGNPDLVLTTISANTVEITNLRWSGGTSGVSGIDNLQLTVDPSNNQVTVVSLGNTTLANWAGQDNYYDPATRTFHLAFDWTTTTGGFREYEMVIQWNRPR